MNAAAIIDQAPEYIPPDDDMPQGLLFGEAVFFLDDSTTPRPEAECYAKHTGKSLDRRPALLAAILDRLAVGISVRDVTRIFKVSHNTVRQLIARWEADGKLDTHKERVRSNWQWGIQLGQEAWIQSLQDGLISGAQAHLQAAIASDKLDAMGASGESARVKGVDREAILAFVAAGAGVVEPAEIAGKSGATDSQSAVSSVRTP